MWAGLRDWLMRPWRVWDWIESLHQRGWNTVGYRAAVGAFVLLLIGITYSPSNFIMASLGRTVWDPTSAIDLAIPFIPWSIVAYYNLYWLFYPLPIWAHPSTPSGRKELYLTGQAMLIINFIALFFHVVFPAEVYFRDDVVANHLPNMHAIPATMFNFLYSADEAFNAWPSLHVAQTVLITLVTTRWAGMRIQSDVKRKFWLTLLWLAAIALCLSILTTKQHFAWDLLTGLILGWVIWAWLLLPSLNAISCDEDE